MIPTRIIYRLALASLLILPVFARAQSYPAELVRLSVSRNLWIAGEDLDFSSDISLVNAASDQLSGVLYVELIRPDGSSLAAGKYQVNDGISTGCLIIPGNLLTGYYYLKAYTRWMRNGPAESYDYKLLKIINPYNALLSPQMNSTAHDSITAFSPAKQYPEILFLPETRGITITGTLTASGNQNPVSNTLVSLSVIGEHDMMAVRTGENGRFAFSLPALVGKRDLFLCSEDLPDLSCSILVDNDFCSRPVHLSTPSFMLTEDERNRALELANAMIKRMAIHPESNGSTDHSGDSVAFYGTPDEILLMDQYIDLPTIEDYFSELLGAVNVRKAGERKLFRFNSDRTEMLIYDPLLMVDWVAVSDVDKILGLSPRQISRIELVNAPYIKGDIVYGGIISFVSVRGDFAGIDLPASGTFISYGLFSECAERKHD